MAVTSVIPVLLIVLIARCRSEPPSSYSQHNGDVSSPFGELLKPPPPPPSLSQIVPVPFHGGTGRTQQHNADFGYQYQPPPPPPPPPLSPSSDLKFPAPFYKQYNFNFVPPPQPFTTTPSPSLFQKFSGWLFPSQQSQYDVGSTLISNNNIAQFKKDCNPCNLVPWIPVIRYNIGAKNIPKNTIPTYGPPSPTAYAEVQSAVQYRPQPFQPHSQQQELRPISGVPHAVYGPPTLTQPVSSIGTPSSTYGPPSPTHVIPLPTSNPPSSTYSIASSSYALSSGSTLELDGSSDPSVNTYGLPSSSYGVPSSTYKPPSTVFPDISSHSPPGFGLNTPPDSDVEILSNITPSSDLQLPRVTNPTGFRNSYGEPILNTYALDIPYPVSATAAESTKIKTKVLPNERFKTMLPNASLALANPAPFTLNRGRNIHKLQPVALPNLSVSPLPPIFNARPFRPVTKIPTHYIHGINSMQHSSNNVNIESSIPVAEFTHSIDYPPSVIQSPIIDIEVTKNTSQNKAYRNIPNSYDIDEFRDISSQASEDHVSATNSNQDVSFESTGAEVGNDIYSKMPSDLKYNPQVPLNHKSNFADLRGIKDEDVDKYRTESNLQSIDSPLLYLKPSAPHKDPENFLLSLSTPVNKEYEIYDDMSTTNAPQITTPNDLWDDTRADYSDYGGVSPLPVAQEDANQPNLVQIIIPYTTGNHDGGTNNNFEDLSQNWISSSEDNYQARKVPLNTDENHDYNTVTESSTMSTTFTEESTETPYTTVTELYNSEVLNTPAILNDLYDVKEPPFDIIKLQHNIDDWTEQQYSKRHKTPEKMRGKGKYVYAKQIPDEYLATISPYANYATTNKYNYDMYDHEGSSSVQYSITDEKKNKTSLKRHKEYNTIERTKNKHLSGKNDDSEVQKLHIYTAASSFRTTTTTPAPWGQIQTSISPLTKEKIYVVTSKPWRASPNATNNWYEVESFESKRTNADNAVSGSDNLPFKSPRFPNRPSIGYLSGEKTDNVKSDSSYEFSKSWHQRINDLEPSTSNDEPTYPEGPYENNTTNTDKVTTVTAEPHNGEQT